MSYLGDNDNDNNSTTRRINIFEVHAQKILKKSFFSNANRRCKILSSFAINLNQYNWWMFTEQIAIVIFTSRQLKSNQNVLLLFKKNLIWAN